MKLTVDDTLKEICLDIKDSNYSLEEWIAYESDDYFQKGNYEGGFDATEQAFCFSYYDNKGNEYWFHFSLDEVNKILSGEIKVLDTRPAG